MGARLAAEANIVRVETLQSLRLSVTSSETDTSAEAPVSPTQQEPVLATYKVVRATWLKKTPSPLSERLAYLDVDTVVDVSQVKLIEERFWAKAKDPSGWITVRTCDNGIDWAVEVRGNPSAVP